MGGASPCASCKLLRRRCTRDCIFAPFFPADDPQKFAIVHKVFGASNVSKMLQELAAQQRGDAVSSMVYEANARLRDPVYGCVGAISFLQNQVSQLQMQLAVAQAEVLCVQMQQQQAPADDGGALQLAAAVADVAVAGSSRTMLQLDVDAGDAVGAAEAYFLMAQNGGGYPGQVMSSYAGVPPAAVHYAQDRFKRESLWT